MECYCCLRNVHGKTTYERRFGSSFNGPIIPFGALVGYLPNSERHKVSAEPKRATSMSDVARARGPAVRRRERRLRAFWRHEIMAVKIGTNSANHHSAQRQTVLYVDTGAQKCTWTCMDSEKESLDGSVFFFYKF